MIKILLDMNLSPQWVKYLRKKGIEAVHWSDIGDGNTKDIEIIHWAKCNEYVIFTHDLDFSAILSSTNEDGPSVIQIRTQDVLPTSIGNLIVNAINQFGRELKEGALLSINANRSRVRILPLKRDL